jgi:hypothetical protein
MKKFWHQTVIFILAISVAQLIIGRIGLSFPGFNVLNAYLKEENQIIYLGDSVVDKIDPSDTKRLTIPEMLRNREPKISIADYSHPAYHTRVFEDIVSYIARQPKKPEAIIIPVNMGIFSPGWNKPEYQFEKEKFYFTVKPSEFNAFFKPLAVFNAINVNTVSEEEYLSSAVYYEQKNIGTVRDFEDPKKETVSDVESIRNAYLFRYLYSNVGREDEHPNFLALERTLDTANRAGIKVYLYITPIDVDGGKKYAGDEFLEHMKTNTALICAVAKKNDTPCLNLAFGLRRNGFYFGDFPNEHLNEKGRMFVAEEIHKFFFKN